MNTREKGSESKAAERHRTEAPLVVARLHASQEEIPSELRQHKVFEFDTTKFPFRELVQKLVLGKHEADDETYQARVAALQV